MNKTKKLGTALITGAAKRIGREMALNLAGMGYDLIIAYRNSKEEAEELAQTKKLAEFAKENFPSWNLLINNASIFNKSKFLTAPESEMMENMNIHLFSPLILAKEFVQHVEKNSIKNAQIINMIDKNIARIDTNYFYYLLSKKSLAEFTKMLAVEIAPQVRVNGIAPGFILNSISEENPSLETQNLIKKIPMKAQGEIENIWQAMEFLLKNKFVTGQILFIDGGSSLNHAG